MACGGVMLVGSVVGMFISHHSNNNSWETERLNTSKRSNATSCVGWLAVSPPFTAVWMTLPGTIKQTFPALLWAEVTVFQRGVSSPFQWPEGPPLPASTRHTARLHLSPSTLSSYRAEWVAHCAMSVTQNPFTALNICSHPPPSPPPSPTTHCHPPVRCLQKMTNHPQVLKWSLDLAWPLSPPSSLPCLLREDILHPEMRQWTWSAIHTSSPPPSPARTLAYIYVFIKPTQRK